MSSSSLRLVNTDTGPFLIKTLQLSSGVSIELVLSLRNWFALSSRFLWPQQLTDWAIARFVNDSGISQRNSTDLWLSIAYRRSHVMIRNWFRVTEFNNYVQDDCIRPSRFCKAIISCFFEIQQKPGKSQHDMDVHMYILIQKSWVIHVSLSVQTFLLSKPRVSLLRAKPVE